MIKKSIFNWEPCLFFLAFIIHILPILLLTPFVTLDGPAHLYNAHLMKELLFENNNNLHSFFEFNAFPEPNWTGHFILSLLQLIVPVLWAEKFIMILIFILTAYGFRKLIFQINENAIWLSWFVFPFLFNFTFLLGFYNFALAIALLPWWMCWWLKSHYDRLHLKNGLFTMLFFVILYFSHLVVFLLAGLSAGIISVFNTPKSERKNLGKQLLYLFIVALPGLFLSFLFVFVFGTGGYRGEVAYLPVSQLINDLLFSRMFVVYDYASEKVFTLIFGIIVLALTLIGFIKISWTKNQISFGLITLLSLILIFIIPDSMASGGILSVRFVQWFYMAWCIWMATLNLPKKINIFAAVLALSFSLGMMKIHWRVQKELNETAQYYLEASDRIAVGSVVLPINYSSNWMHSNLSCYLGAIKSCVILDNYEATQKVFPLLWKKNMDPEIHLGNHVSSNRPCVNMIQSEELTGIKIDYISLWQEPSDLQDSCSADLKLQMNQLKFKSILKKESIQLFER